MLPRTRAGRLTVAFLVVFTIAMNPPVITLVDAPATVLGISSLYLWTVAWGIAVSVVFIWAAYENAFALTEDQVPPELRASEDVVTTRATERETAPGGDR